MDKLNEQLVQGERQRAEGRTIYLKNGAINMNQYLWYVSQNLSLSNQEAILLHMPCRSKVWHSLFCTLVEQMDIEDVKSAIFFAGNFIYLVPMGILQYLTNKHQDLASRIQAQPTNGKYNYVILSDDIDLCSVHLLKPEVPPSN